MKTLDEINTLIAFYEMGPESRYSGQALDALYQQRAQALRLARKRARCRRNNIVTEWFLFAAMVVVFALIGALMAGWTPW